MRTKIYSSRYLELLKILRKNSLFTKYKKFKNSKKNPDDSYDPVLEKEFGQSLRISLEEMGPTFIKFGQMLSTRADLLPKNALIELEKLQDEVPAFLASEAIGVIEEAYGRKLNEIFDDFNETPIAQGSIAQVHVARLKNKDKVAVKVQRPGIKEAIRLDITILERLVKRYNKYLKINDIVNLKDLVEEFKDQIFDEIDFVKETRSLLRFASENRDDKYVFTPHVYKDLINEKVMVMEFLKAKSIKTLSPSQIQRDGEEIANRLIYSFANQVFEHGYFHADPHPGNILIDDNLALYLTDFGIIGTLSDRKKYSLLKLFMGISLNSTRIIHASLLELGAIGSSVNARSFEFEMQSFLDKYMKLSLKEIKVADIFNNFIMLLYKYEIKIDRSLLTLGKTILILEGVIEFLDKKSSLLELSKPIARKLFKRFVSFDYVKNYFLDTSVDGVELLSALPRTVLNLSRRFEDNGLEVSLVNKEDERIINLELEKIRQGQRNVFIGLSVFVFIITLLVLSLFDIKKYDMIWKLMAYISGASSFILGAYSIYKYFSLDVDEKGKEIRNKLFK